MTFIKHGDLQSITQIIDVPEIIDESVKESIEKTKKAAELPNADKDSQKKYSLRGTN